jgi:hypothetical protein
MNEAANIRTTGPAFAVVSSICFGASGPFGKALITPG